MQDTEFYIDLDGEADNQLAQAFFEDGPVRLADFYDQQEKLEEVDGEPFTLQALWESADMSEPETIPGWTNLSVAQAAELYWELASCPHNAPFELVREWVTGHRDANFPTTKDLYDMNPDRVINLSEVAGNTLRDKFLTLTRHNNPGWLEVTDPEWEEEEDLIQDAIDRWEQGSCDYGGWLVIDDEELL